MVGVQVIAALEGILDDAHLRLRIARRREGVQERERALGAAEAEDDTEQRQRYHQPGREFADAVPPARLARLARRASLSGATSRSSRRGHAEANGQVGRR